jgi:peptide/nickel transport system permease protein
MLAYIVRRSAYGFVVVLGVLLLLFALFFLYAEPIEMARRAVGEKAPPEVLEQWVVNHGYDKPAWWNSETPGDTMIVDHFRRMLSFDFGRSDADDSPIIEKIRMGMGPSLSLTLPIFTLGIGIGITLALFVAYFRETYIDRMGVVLCVFGMSLTILLYIIGGQYVIGMLLRWFPISGFDFSPAMAPRFLALPVLVGLLEGLGGSIRFYRTVFIEETHRDYVRTARAKGCGDGRIMTRHVLRNAMIPILTQVVVSIPFLFVGSLLLESFFGIPGLGYVMVEAIHGNDFSTLRAMVYISALLFIAAQIATDVAYTIADPRVRLA